MAGVDPALADRIYGLLVALPALDEPDSRAILLRTLKPDAVDLGGSKQAVLRRIVDTVASWGVRAILVMLENAGHLVPAGSDPRLHLEELNRRIREDADPPRPRVAVAVVAMLLAEAERLLRDRIPSDLSEVLHQDATCTAEELHSCYGRMRDDWIPPQQGRRSIRDILQSVRSRLNLDRESGQLPALEFVSLSEELLGGDQLRASQVATSLATDGGLVVVDAISLLHPGVRAAFESAKLGEPHSGISVVVVAPHRLDLSPLGQKLERDVYCGPLRLHRESSEHDLWRCYEFDVVSVLSLSRRLYSSLESGARARHLSAAQAAAISSERPVDPRLPELVLRGAQ